MDTETENAVKRMISKAVQEYFKWGRKCPQCQHYGGMIRLQIYDDSGSEVIKYKCLNCDSMFEEILELEVHDLVRV